MGTTSAETPKRPMRAVPRLVRMASQYSAIITGPSSGGVIR
ncbi:hypothetical protein ACFROD_21770 [Streptomyces mirabilis]